MLELNAIQIVHEKAMPIFVLSEFSATSIDQERKTVIKVVQR